MNNINLHTAKQGGHDEFYTRLEDVENELRHHERRFAGKTVYCNCDNPFTSAFPEYFTANFNRLGLKKLICTNHCGVPADTDLQPSLFDEPPTIHPNPAYKAVITRVDGQADMRRLSALDGNSLTGLHGAGAGDFRSKECLDLLDEADIVVTNPPFSLFREYVKTLTDHGKKFIIIGNLNAVTYKNVFQPLRDGRLRLGVSVHAGGLVFNIPDDYPLDADVCGVDENGRRYIRVKNARWYTNMENDEPPTLLPLTRRYKGHEDEYPKYDNYNAIEVSKIADIPEDYDGIMGVPITFVDKHNPNQFEIVGCTAAFGRPHDWPDTINMTPTINGRRLYRRLLIRRTHKRRHG